MYTAKGAKGKLTEGKTNKQKHSPIISSKKKKTTNQIQEYILKVLNKIKKK